MRCMVSGILLFLVFSVMGSDFNTICLESDITTIRQNLRANPSLVDAKDQYGCTPLYNSIMNNRRDVASLLIESGADINSENGRGYTYTPLYLSAQKGFFEIVRTLVERSAIINKGDSYGCSPLWIAISEGHNQIARYLLEQGADCHEANKKNGKRPFHIATQRHMIDILAMLLDRGVDVNCGTENTSSITALQLAAMDGECSIVKFLLEKGANANIICKNGLTPLDEAEYRNNMAVVSLLKSRGAKKACELRGSSRSSSNYKTIKKTSTTSISSR